MPTENGRHLNSEGEFSGEQLQAMMKRELWRYSRRQLTNVLSISGDEQFRSTILMLVGLPACRSASDRSCMPQF